MILTEKVVSIGSKCLAEFTNIQIKGGKEFGKVKLFKLFLSARFGTVAFLSALI